MIRWTAELDKQVLELSHNSSDKSIAKILHTTEGAIRSRRYRLHERKDKKLFPIHTKPRVKQSSFGEVLRKLTPDITLKELADIVGYSNSAIAGACSFNPNRTLSNFAVNCIADALMLNANCREELLNAAITDKKIYSKVYIK